MELDVIGLKSKKTFKYILNACSFGVALSIKQLKKISFTIINKGINKKDFVTCTDLLFNKGDLGNQLFKYAVIRKYSRKYGVPVLLPEPNAHRLSELNIKCEYYAKHILELYSINKYKERQFHYDASTLSYAKKKDFYGFFQTEKYFKDIRHILQNEIQLADHKKEKKAIENINSIKRDFPGKEIVSIHVRRGDYIPSKKWYSDGITNYSPDRHLKFPLLTVGYFQSAAARFQNAVFLVFSDTSQDIEWCKENLDIKDTIYAHNEDLIDFKMMQFSDHNIISNSSFSWWAAWLNNNPDKRVISPREEDWFGEYFSHYNMKDLIPGDWEQL